MFKNLLLMSTLAFVLASSAPTNEAAEGKYIYNAISSENLELSITFVLCSLSCMELCFAERSVACIVNTKMSHGVAYDCSYCAGKSSEERQSDAGCNSIVGYCCCNDNEYFEACKNREYTQATPARPVGGQYQGYPYEVRPVSV